MQASGGALADAQRGACFCRVVAVLAVVELRLRGGKGTFAHLARIGINPSEHRVQMRLSYAPVDATCIHFLLLHKQGQNRCNLH